MQFSTFTITSSTDHCQPRLGDTPTSPTFHRVSTVCPVLHLFGYVSGPTIDPLPACLHVHGAYPCFLVPQYRRRVSATEFGAQLEAVALQQHPFKTDRAVAGHQQLLHSVELVSRVPLYGYHAHKHAFYRVSVIDPRHMEPLRRLLEGTTAVGGRHWQLYDAHVSYASQFCITHDIKGIAPFTLSPDCQLRRGDGEDDIAVAALLDGLVSAVLLADEVPKRSRCRVELDVSAASLRGTGTGTESGEHLASIQRELQAYFAQHSIDDGLRTLNTMEREERDGPAVAGFARYGKVDAIQAADPLAREARELMMQILAARDASRDDRGGEGARPALSVPPPLGPRPGTVAPRRPFRPRQPGSQQDADYLGSPRSLECEEKEEEEEEEGVERESLSPVSPLTYELLDALARAGDTAAVDAPRLSPNLWPLASSPSRPSPSSLVSEPHRELPGDASGKAREEVDGEDEVLLVSSQSVEDSRLSCSLPLLLSGGSEDNSSSPGDIFTVGGDVAFGIRRVSRSGRFRPEYTLLYTARIAALTDATVTLRWFLPLGETALASQATELMREKAWVAAGASSTHVVPLGELFLGSAVDENARLVLQDGFPLRDTKEGEEDEDEDEGLFWWVTRLRVCLGLGVYETAVRAAATRSLSLSSSSPAVFALCRYYYDTTTALLSPLVMVPAGQRSRVDSRVFLTQRGSIILQPEPLEKEAPPQPRAHDEWSDSEDSRLSQSSATSGDVGSALAAEDREEEEEEEEAEDEDVLFPSQSSSPPRRNAAADPLCQSELKQLAASKLSLVRSVHLTRASSSGERNAVLVLSENTTAPEVISLSDSSVWGTPGLGAKRDREEDEEEEKQHPQPLTVASSDSAIIASSPASVEYVGGGPHSPLHPQQSEAAAATPAARMRIGVPVLERLRACGGRECAFMAFRDAETGRVAVSAAGAWCLKKGRRTAAAPSASPPTASPSIALMTQLRASLVSPPAARGIVAPPTPKTAPPATVTGGLLPALRLAYVEVLLDRRSDQRRLASDTLLAVAVADGSSSRASLRLRLYCVRPPSPPGLHHQQQQCRPPYRLSGGVQVMELASERELLSAAVRAIVACDPDVLLSWDGYKYGLGLLSLRYRAVTGRSLSYDLSRWQGEGGPGGLEVGVGADVGREEEGEEEEEESESSSSSSSQPYARRFGATVWVPGRCCISAGRAFLKTMPLPSFTLAMALRELFHESVPVFTDTAAAALYREGPASHCAVLRHLAARTVGAHRVARHLNALNRTCEFSRMYGILFEEALTRGSQFRVEMTLLRLAWPLGYTALSPSQHQTLAQPRIQHIPLIMAPKAGLYREDPVIVLDFRSLYPSVIIAYNLCYSTCLGLVQPHASGRLGVLPQYRQDSETLRTLLLRDKDSVVFSPNGAVFVSAAVREGLLPRMLRLVLDTRFQAQAAAKVVAGPAGDTFTAQRLEEQQLALKMLANTTYGYTAAGYTGRMPCVDVAEAIVSLGRQTLERAMALVHATPEWHGEVVYGDTDSLFVRLRGRSRAEAFDIGEAIAAAVSAANPFPIRLQFEKVMHPCLLLVKKRYVGYSWETRTQAEPRMIAKGIETVRRDQCPATTTIATELLHRLLRGATPAELRTHYEEQVSRLQSGEVHPSAFIFRRAVKLGRYGSDDTHLPLAARLALQRMETDAAETPFWGERVAYVVTRSNDSERLRDQVAHPTTLLYLDSAQETMVDTDYYITRHVNAALSRMLTHVEGVSVARWYRELPRRRERRWFYWQAQQFWDAYVAPAPPTSDSTVVDVDEEGTEGKAARRTRGGTLDAYYPQTLCLVCRKESVPLEAQARTLARFTRGAQATAHRPRGRWSEEELRALTALPPICSACWSCPPQLWATVRRRLSTVENELQAVGETCRRCIGGDCGGGLVDIECCAVPHAMAAAVCSPGGATSLHANAHGCVSFDCDTAFLKTRLTLVERQLRLLLWFLNKLL